MWGVERDLTSSAGDLGRGDVGEMWLEGDLSWKKICGGDEEAWARGGRGGELEGGRGGGGGRGLSKLRIGFRSVVD